MVDVAASFKHWLENVDDCYKPELEALKADEDKLFDAFYRDLAFGTAGLRGVIGMGSNRMNVYTVGKATQGLANYLVKNFDNPSVAIARDSRIMGEEFVKAAAGVLAGNGVHVYVYPRIEPTPALSFAVRDLACSAGINVTASHNPAPYNGYKVYGPDGCQIASQAAADIQQAIDGLDFFEGVRRADFDEAVEAGDIEWIDEGVLDRFIDAVAAESVEELDATTDSDLKLVYTPLNGTGYECVTRILDKIGITDVTVVPEQADPDGNFPTCSYPNPESRDALELGLKLCDELKPDLLLATDPDADRVGIAVPHNGEYVLLTGNEVGVLLIDYLCTMRAKRGEDLKDKVVITTIVSSEMPDAQSEEFGFQLRRVLTGFKYIGGQIAMMEEAGRADRYILGYEESYGYLSGSYVRDKDAINASMLICQMARWHKSQGRDLVDAMEQLYAKHGYYLNRTVSLSYPGAAGAEKMSLLMQQVRENPPARVADMDVVAVTDYAQGVKMPVWNQADDADQMLPQANVVSLRLGAGTKVLIRPSGTEPKIKAYLFAKGSTREEAQALLDRLDESARDILS